MEKPKVRTIVKARMVAGSVVLTIPALLREAIGISPGDRVSIEASSDSPDGEVNLLEVRKE